MKRIFAAAVAIFAMQALVFAQTCPDGSITTPGFTPPAAQLAPIQRGMAYDETVQVNIPEGFDTFYLGAIRHITINNVHVDTINGAPAGINHSCTNNCDIPGAGAGCVNFTGTTNDPAAQYPLDIIVTATVSLGSIPLPSQHLHISRLGFAYYLTVIEPGALSVIASASPASICPGDSSTLTATVTNGTGSETFAWSGGAGFTNPVKVAPNAPTTYTVIVTDGGNTATASVTVTVNTVPTAAIAPATVSVCSGASATLTASGGGTYSWTTGETTAAITVSPTSPTAYTVTVTGTGGCTAIASRAVTINPTPAPVADFGYTVSKDTVTFADSSTNATSYSWDFGDGSSGTDPNPTHTYSGNGDFEVMLTVTGTCGTDTYTDSVSIVGVYIGSIANDLKFSVYPNPNEGIFTVTLSDNSGKPNTVKIYDLSGKNVFEETFGGASGMVNKQLDLSYLPKGVYTLHLSSEKGNGVQKLVIR